jgi:hypothetical protein
MNQFLKVITKNNITFPTPTEYTELGRRFEEIGGI